MCIILRRILLKYIYWKRQETCQTIMLLKVQHKKGGENQTTFDTLFTFGPITFSSGKSVCHENMLLVKSQKLTEVTNSILRIVNQFFGDLRPLCEIVAHCMGEN